MIPARLISHTAVLIMVWKEKEEGWGWQRRWNLFGQRPGFGCGTLRLGDDNSKECKTGLQYFVPTWFMMINTKILGPLEWDSDDSGIANTGNCTTTWLIGETINALGSACMLAVQHQRGYTTTPILISYAARETGIKSLFKLLWVLTTKVVWEQNFDRWLRVQTV